MDPDLAGTDADQRIGLLRALGLCITADESDSFFEATLRGKLTAVLDRLTVEIDAESDGIGSRGDDTQEKLAPAAADVEHYAPQITREEPDEAVGPQLRQRRHKAQICVWLGQSDGHRNTFRSFHWSALNGSREKSYHVCPAPGVYAAISCHGSW